MINFEQLTIPYLKDEISYDEWINSLYKSFNKVVEILIKENIRKRKREEI